MVNTKISQIANRIALGENKYKESQNLDVNIKAGQVVKQTATGIALHNLDAYFLGVMKEHEEFDLDTAITLGKEGDIITEGYIAVFIEDPKATKYPGTFLYKGLNGAMAITAMGAPFAVLERTINTGDLVAIVKILR